VSPVCCVVVCAPGFLGFWGRRNMGCENMRDIGVYIGLPLGVFIGVYRIEFFLSYDGHVVFAVNSVNNVDVAALSAISW